jgi:hypothetical protein
MPEEEPLMDIRQIPEPGAALRHLDLTQPPPGSDRRAFMTPSALAVALAMALTAKETNANSKATSEGGLAVSVTLG